MGVFWYCIGGWCLIPLPFAIAAIVASKVVRRKHGDKMPWGLKVALWGIGITIVGLAVLFLWFILMVGSSGHFYKE
jgi:hypothetical protein